MGVSHWDELEWFRQEAGEMAASWCRMGDAAGTAAVGVDRIRIEPGRGRHRHMVIGRLEQLDFWDSEETP
jgi:uncharacterized cupin superfamily protein